MTAGEQLYINLTCMFGEYQPYKCWNTGNDPENKLPSSLDHNR